MCLHMPERLNCSFIFLLAGRMALKLSCKNPTAHPFFLSVDTAHSATGKDWLHTGSFIIELCRKHYCMKPVLIIVTGLLLMQAANGQTTEKGTIAVIVKIEQDQR